jgi:outer membrane lipoprotein carrier protein
MVVRSPHLAAFAVLAGVSTLGPTPPALGQTTAAAPAPAAPAASAAATLPTPKPLPAARTAEVVAKVQAFYDKTTSFSSDFQQQYWVKAYNQKKASRGQVLFAKPGKMDWAYVDPKDNRVVSDGATIKVYEAANKQMYEQQLGKSQYPAALSFLTGEGKLADAFTFELYAGEDMEFSGGLVLSGKPKVETPAYQRVLFYVDAQTSQVRRVLIVDGQGNRNRFDFVNPRVNVPVSPSQFKFTPPPGTSVIRP